MKKDKVVMRGMVALVLCIMVALSFVFYFALQPIKCDNFSCFDEHMRACRPAVYVNEESQASWVYNIKGSVKEGCSIDVKLAQAKEGELELRKLEGLSMNCVYPEGTVAYPDKEMARCHGILKEELQQIIIEKIHSYLLNNLNDVRAALNYTAPL